MIRTACVQCGLPVATVAERPAAAVYCCHGCRLAAAIVGQREGGDVSWRLLRLGLAGLLSMSVMMIALLFYTGDVEAGAARFFEAVMLILATLSLAVSLPPFCSGAADEIRHGRLALDSLVVGGAFAAFGVSVVNTMSGNGPVYYDTATMLPVFLAFGRILEMSAKEKSTRLLQALDDLLPASALLVAEDGSVRDISPSLLQPGDLIRIRPGERVAADGIIEDGTSTFEESHLTGETLPRFRTVGDEVAAGAVNGAGSILVRVVRVGDDLFISRITESVINARLTAAPWDRIAERAAAFFVPVTLLVAIGAAAGWWLADRHDVAVTAFLSVLVVACPCALGIATPLATSQAIARAAREGILVRGGDILERVGEVDLLLFDKTGTLTSGTPRFAGVVSLDPDVGDMELIQWAASLEAVTSHVFARTVLAEAAARELPLGEVRDIAFLAGGGISAVVTLEGRRRRVAVGRISPDAPGTPPDVTGFEVSWGGKARGRIFVTDELRAGVPKVAAELHRLGIEAAIVSGDGREAVASAGRRAGFGRVESHLTPAEKADLVKKERQAGRIVAMVGDGVNDAPALAAAGVGVAVGGGSDLTRLTGDVVLLSDNLHHIPWLIGLSRRTRRIIRENIGWAFCYNTIAVTAAASGLLHPLGAALAMVGSSLSVVANSSRLRNFPHPPEK